MDRSLEKGRLEIFANAIITCQPRSFKNSLKPLLDNLPMLVYLQVTGILIGTNEWKTIDEFKTLFKSHEPVLKSMVNTALGIKFKALRDLYAKLSNQSIDFVDPFQSFLQNFSQNHNYIIQEFEFFGFPEYSNKSNFINLWKERTSNYYKDIHATSPTIEYFRVLRKTT